MAGIVGVLNRAITSFITDFVFAAMTRTRIGESFHCLIEVRLGHVNKVVFGWSTKFQMELFVGMDAFGNLFAAAAGERDDCDYRQCNKCECSR